MQFDRRMAQLIFNGHWLATVLTPVALYGWKP